uniref:RNA helicase n=1 Tax=viral metagenome TaxID=1070528 RepID=A0A6C0E997_9ZZZZ
MESKDDLEIYKTTEYKRFDDMDFLSYELLRGINDYGFRDPSYIQGATIGKIYAKVDLVAQSQSGTGKTGAFTIGALSRVNSKLNKPQIIIIVHTRELAEQVHSVISDLGKYMSLKITKCTGDDSRAEFYKDKYRSFNEAVSTSHIIVGTPGKIQDLVERGILKTDEVILAILDEADVLLTKDFTKTIKDIFCKLPKSAQICIFSATYQQEVIDLSNKFMHEPEYLLLDNEELSLDLIKQYKVDLQYEKYKYETLQDIYKNIHIGQCIIFVNSKEGVDSLVRRLVNDGHNVSKIHGGLDTASRCNVLKDFRLGVTRVLVTTDVLSRGIDIQQIGIVINYDLPNNVAQYIHRIGRSGRFGKVGVAINFITDRDQAMLKEIMDHYDIKIPDMPAFDFIDKQLSGSKGHLELSDN